MWLVMEQEIININQVKSISILFDGENKETGEKWNKVCLRYVGGDSDESDLRIFDGTLNECEIFLTEFRDTMLSNRFFYLDSVKRAVKPDKNV